MPNSEENTYIWAGKTYTLNQSSSIKPITAPESAVQQLAEPTERQSNFAFVPRQLQSTKRKVNSPNVSSDLMSTSINTHASHIWNKVTEVRKINFALIEIKIAQYIYSL